MNQGIVFSRTLRALDADGFRASKFGLLVAAILLAAGTWGMVTARVPQYETTANVQFEPGRAIAHFSPPVARRIVPGQSAVISVGGSSIPARVQSIAADRAELVFASDPLSAPGAPSQPASASVEVSVSSPASIAFRTLGRTAPPANR